MSDFPQNVKPKIVYDAMTVQDIEERIASDLIELSNRFSGTSAGPISNLFLRLMQQIGEAFRTAMLLTAR